jgi:uncharacterized SAM-binding protein YcdF (DUF218 family)
MQHQPRVRRLLLAAAAIGLFAFAVLTARLFVGPDLPPLPPEVDAIVELAGPGIRDRAALALAREHRAPILIQSTVASEAGTQRCLPKVQGVTIVCFHPEPGTTRGEARTIGEMARQQHWRSVVLVTTPDHAWRARLRVARCFAGDIYVANSPLPRRDWLIAITHQWAATIKALVFEREC